MVLTPIVFVQTVKEMMYVSQMEEFDGKGCPIPTSGGRLVSLLTVYKYWKENGIGELDDLPTFKIANSTLSLADAKHIELLHTILSGFISPNEPPFKIQYKKDGDEWRDVALSDQIRIAAIMFSMEKTKQMHLERRLIQNNQLLISVSYTQGGFKLDLNDANGGDMDPVFSRFIVVDGGTWFTVPVSTSAGEPAAINL
jgi:hypothetical protein